MSKIYLASSWTRRSEMVGYADFLESQGDEIVSRWIRETTPGRDIGTPNALMDEGDIRRCGILIAFTDESPMGRGGRHVEFGMARALGKILVLIGPREHIFHSLPGIVEYPDWETFKSRYENWSTPTS